MLSNSCNNNTNGNTSTNILKSSNTINSTNTTVSNGAKLIRPLSTNANVINNCSTLTQNGTTATGTTTSLNALQPNLLCHNCMRSFILPTAVQTSSNQIMIVNEHYYYHRECFKCKICDKYLNDNEAYTLVDHKYLYCGNCYMKRKPLQQTPIQTSSLSSLSSPSVPTVQSANMSQQQQQPPSTLNDLKSKFELNIQSFKTLNNTNKSSYTMHNTAYNYQTDQAQQLSSLHSFSSSSSSNFSLSPSSSSSWSSSITNNTSNQTQPQQQRNSLVQTHLNNFQNNHKQQLNGNSQQQTLKALTINNDKSKSIQQNKPATESVSLSNKTKSQNSTQKPTILNEPNSMWVAYKNHSSKCNIILRKMRRGNKRSKSLPPKFSIDSLLDYLNCSMILNKYELKKLHHQRNQLLLNSSANNNSSTGGANNIYLNRHKSLLNHNLYNRSHHHHHQLSSGYNSENYSNSSNSTTTNTSSSSSSALPLNNNNHNNIFNFYRLSINHLPIHFTHAQCTCGASNTQKSLLSPVKLNNYNKQAPLSSSPNVHNTNNIEDDEEDDEVDEDEDDLDEDEDDEDDLDIDDDDDNNENYDNDYDDLDSKSKFVSSDLPLISIHIDTSQSNQTNINNFNNNNNNNNNSNNLLTNQKHDEQPVNRLQRAPGTSHCQHTARIDVRRVRSFRDLSKIQFIYSPQDFLFKDKLGEGFFANVKKIICKKTNEEMVLKELKLNCVSDVSSSIQIDIDNNNTTEQNLLQLSNAQHNLLINYAELNAAHKSFLKEAQVLRNLNHPNVIKFMGIMFTKEKHLNLILEYISGGTLKDIIHNISNVLPWKLRVGYAMDIAAAMEYLHSLNIIHRDLKSDNCLVRENGKTVVVADFGLSRINSNNYTSSSGSQGNNRRNNMNSNNHNNSSTFFPNDSSSSSFVKLHNSILSAAHNSSSLQSPQSSATNSFIVAAKRKLKRRGYHNNHNNNHNRNKRYAVVGNSFSMAPEMLKHQIYDERVDIFSFGIICCEIIGRVQADPDYLPRTSDFGLNVELFRKKYCEADCPKQFIKIAIACCELEPEKRPPFSKTHLWLETILSHLEANNPIPKNLLKNILDQNNTKRPLSTLVSNLNINNNTNTTTITTTNDNQFIQHKI